MAFSVHNEFDFTVELRREADLAGVPVFTGAATGDLADLIEETHVEAVLRDVWPEETEVRAVTVQPQWLREPLVSAVEVELQAAGNGEAARYSRQFAAGRWVRSAQQAISQLCQDGTLQRGETVYRLLLALRQPARAALKVPPLQPPPITRQSLEALGVRELGAGTLYPPRPVLVNRRMVEDILRRCEEAGTSEVGGSVLGKLIRLPQPLPGAATPVTTVLTTAVDDLRHVGAPLSVAFSPEALAEAAGIADLRGFGETIQTVYHTHGWSPKCADCTPTEGCSLTEATPSLQDYQLLESLFSSKATLMPIAGRKHGTQGRRPVLRLFAWQGGELHEIDWQEYHD